MSKKRLLIAIFLVVVAGFFFFAPKVFNLISLQIEKHSLKKPPPFKTLQQIKGLSEVKLASVSGKIKYPHDYTIVMVGDSMTEYLGNSDELKGYLNEYWPDKAFEVLNYGFGSTNILSVYDRLTKTTFNHRDFRPILDIDFDLILIESMGQNPLSQFPLQEGLQKQNEALDQIVQVIREKQPRAKIAFVATLATNKEDFGIGATNLNADQRKKWAEERDDYIKNHMQYAKSHNIPLIDIYDKSIDSQGSAKSIYINNVDHIHPSPTGVLLISKTIADGIHQFSLLP